ncbi:BtrH N-terminal domain-containing protein [Streptomyces sp. NPDC085612]|uniref:BtrH N-terminal domain-containing protein n=1 Tax=Streptomyces sp. NPDC085612 TaxID=3365732 RepID=UPI0037CE62F9
MNDPRPAPRPAGLLYDDFGTGRHHESSLVRHALGSRHEEALVAGLAGGIGFMYFVFEYAGRLPLPTIVAQAHPDPWVPAALDRLRVPYEVGRSSRPRWDRVHAALDDGRPVFCTVDRSGLPWHGAGDEMAGGDPYTVVLAGHTGDTLWVEDGDREPRRISEEEFGAAWSGHRKGRHRMIVPTGPPAGEPDVEGAVAATADRLTGPVLGNRFLAGTGRLHACLEEEWTAPGATRPLYADFLELAGRPEAAALFRESAGCWSAVARPARAAEPDADAEARAHLFDECAALVDSALALERRAVTLF